MKKNFISLLLFTLFITGCNKDVIDCPEQECVPEVITRYVEQECVPEVVTEIVPIEYGPLDVNFVPTYQDIFINGYELYEKYYGTCDLTNESIFYENDDYYWYARFNGCNYDGEYADFYYLLIDRVFIPIDKAIEDGYITFKDFVDANIGLKEIKSI